MYSLSTVSMDYQPIVSARTGEVWMYEALMRLELPMGRGRVYPPQFLQQIENDGSIVSMGLDGIAAAQEWQREYGEKVSINISRQQMMDARTMNALATGDIIGAVEMTEHLTLGEAAEKFVAEVDTLGTLLLLDDFGAGHSNLEALTRVSQISALKIDKSVTQSRGTKLVGVLRSIVHLATELDGVSVVAEGVETAEQARILLDAGVDYLQGWWVGRESRRSLDPVEREEVRQKVLALVRAL